MTYVYEKSGSMKFFRPLLLLDDCEFRIWVDDMIIFILLFIRKITNIFEQMLVGVLSIPHRRPDK